MIVIISIQDILEREKKWHDPKLENVLVSYKLSKLVYEHFGRKIVNATVGGKLDVFDREDFNTLFNK
jgi:hypothetical protein